MAGLTVIVVALGEDPRLTVCLNALRDEVARDDLELVVVENGVVGPGMPLPIEPSVRLRREANPGFAAAVNEALDRSEGSEVLVLNPDATLHRGALLVARSALASDPGIGAIAFRLIRPGGEVLDSAGIRLGWMGRAFDRGMGGPAEGRFLTPADVDGACMACALFRREALLQARDGAGEILDSRFFAYKEDVDLSWRLRRAGYRIRYLPEASATHERGWREGRRREIPVWIRRLSLRNRWFTLLKNESALSLALRMAVYVPWEVAIAGYLLLREPRVLAAYPAILGGLTDTWKRRKLPYAATTASAGSG